MLIYVDICIHTQSPQRNKSPAVALLPLNCVHLRLAAAVGSGSGTVGVYGVGRESCGY